MSEISVRSYRCEDQPALMRTWNAALPYDPIDGPTFLRKVLLDPNFTPDHLLVATADEQIIGLCLCLLRRTAIADEGPDADRGWITAFGVHPDWRNRGAGSELLQRALALFNDAERNHVLISPYTPNYFVPGVDVHHYSDGLAFLQKRGFEVVSDAISMDANITLFDPAQYVERERALSERGIDVRPLRLRNAPALIDFLDAYMPADWLRHARELLADISRGLARPDQILVASRKGQILGYCQFDGGHFGPIGVREDSRGRGIGSTLLAKALGTMHRSGVHNAWLLWTSDETAQRLYAKFGFTETRRFAILRRNLANT